MDTEREHVYEKEREIMHVSIERTKTREKLKRKETFELQMDFNAVMFSIPF